MKVVHLVLVGLHNLSFLQIFCLNFLLELLRISWIETLTLLKFSLKCINITDIWWLTTLTGRIYLWFRFLKCLGINIKNQWVSLFLYVLLKWISISTWHGFTTVKLYILLDVHLLNPMLQHYYVMVLTRWSRLNGRTSTIIINMTKFHRYWNTWHLLSNLPRHGSKIVV